MSDATVPRSLKLDSTAPDIHPAQLRFFRVDSITDRTILALPSSPAFRTSRIFLPFRRDEIAATIDGNVAIRAKATSCHVFTFCVLRI